MSHESLRPYVECSMPALPLVNSPALLRKEEWIEMDKLILAKAGERLRERTEVNEAVLLGLASYLPKPPKPQPTRRQRLRAWFNQKLYNAGQYLIQKSGLGDDAW